MACHLENPIGVIISVGKMDVPIVGTPATAIDMADCRSKFSKPCDNLSIGQPGWSQFIICGEVQFFYKQVNLPVLV